MTIEAVMFDLGGVFRLQNVVLMGQQSAKGKSHGEVNSERETRQFVDSGPSRKRPTGH